ncbi:LacI family DNA-binding transcriptional regulator [Geminisphaera colitermitum]|uniref:LacI family DNA-binding transcriptional regulator n=1 Tax=Geminisphaera colitermitum TaxID=1148786 RepID=UPI000158CC13|nr:LacI family DNA-binding transcriptional regulator [Geminisphaera colitermitum]
MSAKSANGKYPPATLFEGGAGRMTMKDIAKIAGVTLSTVSSALHGTGRVSETQRERIRQLATEYGYQPRAAAQLLRGKSTGQIGLLLPGEEPSKVLRGGYASIALGHLIKQCEQRKLGYHIEFYANPMAGQPHPPRQLAGGLVDGVILCGYVDGGLREWLARQSQYPWVSFEEPADYCVLSATDDGVFNGVQHLSALGHRRIALIAGPQIYTLHRLGQEGFRRAVSAFGIECRKEWTCVFSDEDRAGKQHEILPWLRGLLATKLERRPTAIVTLDIDVGCTVAYEAARAGLDVPRDLSVLAVGSDHDAESMLPCLSTVEMDAETMAGQALDLLGWRLRDALSEPQTRRLQPRLILRETTASPVGRD